MSMYIHVSLPEPYGVFNQIREDNYPFNRLFPKYLRTLVTLARNKEMDVFTLLGYVENELVGGDKLPDLPVSGEALNFRFPIEDELIEDYYKEQDLTNKMITLMIIRTTIRLSEVYGTSLSRIGAVINSIGDRESADKQLTDLRKQLKNKERASAAKIAISEPVKSTQILDEVEVFDRDEASRAELLKKIDELTRKSSELAERMTRRDLQIAEEPRKAEAIEEEDDGKSDNEDGSGINEEDTGENRVVQTNPHLKDFL